MFADCSSGGFPLFLLFFSSSAVFFVLIFTFALPQPGCRGLLPSEFSACSFVVVVYPLALLIVAFNSPTFPCFVYPRSLSCMTTLFFCVCVWRGGSFVCVPRPSAEPHVRVGVDEATVRHPPPFFSQCSASCSLVWGQGVPLSCTVDRG